MLAKESAKALGGLGFLSLGGKFFLGRIFEVPSLHVLFYGEEGNVLFGALFKTKAQNNIQVVAETRSSEAFVALCLLTVAGTSLLTQKLGFSDTV